MSVVLSLTAYFFKTHFNIIHLGLPNNILPSDFTTKML
jgi:hypothetical protein